MKNFTKPTIGMLAVLAGMAMPAAAFAEAHQDNPFVGATVYKNPDYTAKVQTSIAQVTDSSLIAKMQIVAQTPTFVWLDRIAAIAGDATATPPATGLQQHLDNALAQQQGSTPIIAQFVIYDLPGRDCHALASNGEIPLTAAGLTQYQTQYIDAIVAIMSQPKYQNIRIVNVIEPDSLPNLVTNLSTPACGNADSTGIYAAGITYALNKLSALPNTYNYLDIGHSGWLGWPSNSAPAVTRYTNLINGTTNKFASVNGFVTDTANDIPWKEPFMTGGNQTINGTQLISANFYQFDPDIDEASYTADLWARFTAAGWPTTLGFLTDTSRNGWGGPARPTAASTSTDVNTFVNASKIDARPHRGLWCNQSGAGLGLLPQATPSGFPASHVDAYVWVKPPGDSDGSSTAIPNNEGKGFDQFCDPTFLTPLGVLSNALPNAPLSGHWFHTQFVQLVTNANPPIGTTPPPTCGTTPAAPTSVTATAASANQINLSWAAVTPPTNCSVSYNVYRSTTSGFSSSAATQIASALTTTTFSDTGRSASTTYFYIVEAADGAGTAQTRAQATTPTGTNPTCTTTASAVTNLTATANSSSQISLSWSAVTAPTNCSVTYSVHRSTTANFTPSASTLVVSGLTSPSNVSTGLAASTTFFFAVTADDAAGSSTPTRAQATTPGTTGGGTGTCHVGFTVTNSWPTGFQVALSIQNTGTTAVNGWTLTWTFPSGTTVTQLWNGAATQTGTSVSVTNLSYNASIAAGASYNDAGFTGGGTFAAPTNVAINGVTCQ